MAMVDIHSHVMPFVDDGSSSVKDSISLIKEAVQEGVTDLFLTPHYREPYFPEKAELIESFNNFKKQVLDSGIDINLYLGEEVFISKDYKDLLIGEELLTLNQTKYVLIEFGVCTDFEMTEIIYSIVKSGFKPIVAHFERYSFVDVSVASEIRSLGGYIQINSGAIVDAFNLKTKRRVKKLLENGWVDFVASDAHDVRKYSMGKAYEIVTKKYGKETADKIFNNNAKEIIDSQTQI